MNNLMKFQIALDKVSEISPLLLGDAQNELKVKSEEFLNEVQDSQYIKVPLVGVFSAGKSSLLNVFTEKPGMLPVDTMPETAVAYELYYSQNESVELFRNGNKIDSKALSDINQLVTEPGDIVKVYCTSEPIKKLQEKGIILVDMPGIGSGIERHDAAIFNYINSGTAFVLIVDAEQGSLRGNTLAFMNELSRYNMYPAVLVSKIDKKPESDVKNIVEYIQYQMTKLGNTNPFIDTVCSVNNDLRGLNNYLESLNAEALVAEKLGKKFKLIVNDVIDQIKTRVELRSKDIADVDEKIKNIDEEIANVKVELPTNNSTADSPEKSTQDILENVRAALEAKSEDIAQMMVDKEDPESIKAVIISIIRTEIISSLKEESEQYSATLGTAVQESVSGLATIEVNTDIMNDYSDIVEIIKDILIGLPIPGGPWVWIIKIIMTKLSDIFQWLFGKSSEDILKEVRAEFLNKCVTPIINDLQPTILQITIENQKRIKEQIQAELISKMEQVKEGLREKMEDANKSKEEVETEISKLTSALTQLNSIISEF